MTSFRIAARTRAHLLRLLAVVQLIAGCRCQSTYGYGNGVLGASAIGYGTSYAGSPTYYPTPYNSPPASFNGYGIYGGAVNALGAGYYGYLPPPSIPNWPSQESLAYLGYGYDPRLAGNVPPTGPTSLVAGQQQRLASLSENTNTNININHDMGAVRHRNLLDVLRRRMALP